MVVNQNIIYTMGSSKLQNPFVVLYHILQRAPFVINSFFDDIPILFNIWEMFPDIPLAHHQTIVFDVVEVFWLKVT